MSNARLWEKEAYFSSKKNPWKEWTLNLFRLKWYLTLWKIGYQDNFILAGKPELDSLVLIQ